MTPLTLSHFWQRRIYEVLFLLSLAILALFIVPQLSTIQPLGVFAIDLFVAIGAGVTAIASIVLYFLVAKNLPQNLTVVVYLLFTATVGLLIFQTGGTSSPFIALWMLLAFFSGVFAVWGTVPIFIATAIYTAHIYLTVGLSAGIITMISFISIVPMLISIFIWRHHEGVDESSKNVKKLTNELSEIASRSEIIINAIGDGVIAVDSLGVIQLINPAAQEILGWGKQDAMMLNYKSILQMLDANNHDLDPAADPVAQVLNTNQQVRSTTITIRTQSGKNIITSIVVSPIGDAGSGVIAVFRDVTKEKAEEHEQAEFISTASHEMRTPVAAIEGYLGLAMNPNTATVDQRAHDFIGKAHEAAQHLGRLFQDLLDVSRSEDGRMTNTPKVTDLTLYTETIVEGLRVKAQEKGLDISFTPTSQRAQKTITPVYFINEDTDHIREILDNLIENAIKYTPKGEITVDITGTDDKVVVSVKDSGLGIPAEDIPHLFQKFYRINNADRQQIGGTGLGLYLSRRLAEAMQGRLWVESVYQQGSTFFLEIPRLSTEDAERLKQEQAKQAAAAPVPAQTGPVTITSMQANATGAPAAPVSNVPRGQNLTREQIAARVRQLEVMARANPPATPAQAAPAPAAAPIAPQTPLTPPPVQAPSGQPQP